MKVAIKLEVNVAEIIHLAIKPAIKLEVKPAVNVKIPQVWTHHKQIKFWWYYPFKVGWKKLPISEI